MSGTSNGRSTASGRSTDIVDFFKGVRSELAKVTWPTRDKVVSDTILVVAGSLLAAAFLGGLDLLFTWLLEQFFA